MPKLEPKLIQRELEQGQIWPVYWLYGQEKMKSRELLKRIRRAVLGEEDRQAGGSLLGLSEQVFDAAETSGAAILDAALSPCLTSALGGGGVQLIVVRDAHALKDTENLIDLLQPRTKKENLSSVCVFLSKDLDARKKFSKLLIEKAAVIPCEEIPEGEREAWIQYLVKRRGIALPPARVSQLVSLDPWTLDIIDQELEKYSLEGGAGEVILSGASVQGGGDAFLEAFFGRKLRSALESASEFADQPDEALPLLGLLVWNARYLALWVSLGDSAARRSVKLNPYAVEKISRWSRNWNLSEALELQSELAAVDFGFKQTPLLPLGLWTSLVTKFCS